MCRVLFRQGTAGRHTCPGGTGPRGGRRGRAAGPRLRGLFLLRGRDRAARLLLLLLLARRRDPARWRRGRGKEVRRFVRLLGGDVPPSGRRCLARADRCSALLPWPAVRLPLRARGHHGQAKPPQPGLLVRLACRGDGAMARLDATETFAGLWLPGHLHTQESLRAACAFPFRPSDVLLVTYPKSGTTWMQEILTLIYSRGDPKPAVSIPTWARAPWLEHVHFKELLQETQGPRLLTTHLPWRVLADALRKGKPKVIYVARNPKDVAVSFYHFHKMANFFPDPGTLDDFLPRFLDGTVHYGSWFQHVKGWLSCQEEVNLFCLTYEELHRDLGGCVNLLSAFVGCPLQPGQQEAIVGRSTFASMRENAMANYTLIPTEVMDPSKGTFMRKGIVGDWKNHFSAEQSALFDKAYQQEMGGCSLSFQGHGD